MDTSYRAELAQQGISLEDDGSIRMLELEELPEDVLYKKALARAVREGW